jgi:hypothetical protein
MKEYIDIVNERFSGKSKELLLKQIDLFFEDENIPKNKYSVGEDVFLNKGTFMHGILGDLDAFDYTVNNGFISTNFTGDQRSNKIFNSVGFWNIREDMLLKDYINLYSGFTLSYSIGRGPDASMETILVPYHKFDEVTEEINNREDVWMYWGDQTKEVRFMPSLVSSKRQIAFILNMDSEYAKELSYNDVWNLSFDKETVAPFLNEKYIDTFIEKDRIHPTAATTDRESAIMFGLPISLVEGVFVGRKIENDEVALNHIKEKLPDCYICNLDGKVIVGNK